MGAIVNGLVLQRLPRLRRRLPDLQRLHEGRRSGSPRSCASRRPSCSRTTRSASARTARRTSRSSSSRRCARRRTSTSCGPPASTRPRWPGASRCAQTETPTALALSRQGLPVWDPAGVPDDAIERGAYVLHETADGEPELILMAHRLRGPHRPRRRQAARSRRRPGTPREHAVPGPLRRAGPGLPRQRAAAVRARARGRRGREPARLAPLGRRRTATSWRWRASAPPRRRRRSTSTSASPARPSPSARAGAEPTDMIDHRRPA